MGIKKAEHQYYKSKREADYSAGSHGLTGDLTANYSFGRGIIEREVDEIQLPDDDINTNSWGVSLNFTYPIWDGGSSGAAVKAARFQSDQEFPGQTIDRRCEPGGQFPCGAEEGWIWRQRANQEKTAAFDYQPTSVPAQSLTDFRSQDDLDLTFRICGIEAEIESESIRPAFSKQVEMDCGGVR